MSLLQCLQNKPKVSLTAEHTAELTRFNIKFKLATAGNPDDIDLSVLDLNKESKNMASQTLASYQHSQYQTKKLSQREESLKSARFLEKSLSDSTEYSDDPISNLRQSDERANRDRSRSPNSRNR